MNHTPAYLASCGYAVISRRHHLVARIDRHDWKEVLASTHASGHEWVNALGPVAAADYYRRCVSPDRLTVPPSYLTQMPTSGAGPTQFFPGGGLERRRQRPTRETFVAQADEFPTLDNEQYPEPLRITQVHVAPPVPDTAGVFARAWAWLRARVHVHTCATAPGGHLRLDLSHREPSDAPRCVSFRCESCGQRVLLGVAEDEA